VRVPPLFEGTPRAVPDIMCRKMQHFVFIASSLGQKPTLRNLVMMFSHSQGIMIGNMQIEDCQVMLVQFLVPTMMQDYVLKILRIKRKLLPINWMLIHRHQNNYMKFV
jgi:hypothetical protein